MNTTKEKVLIKALNDILKKVPEEDDYDPGQFVMDVEEIANDALYYVQVQDKKAKKASVKQSKL